MKKYFPFILLCFTLGIICLAGFAVPSEPYTVKVVISPSDSTVCYGTLFEFNAKVSDKDSSFTYADSTIHYQWQRNSTPISGATNMYYTIPSVNDTSTGTYRCIVKVDGHGSAISNESVLSMHPKAHIDLLSRYSNSPLACPTYDSIYFDSKTQTTVIKPVPLCKSQYIVHVSGGTPLLNVPHYYWYGDLVNEKRYPQGDTLLLNLCPGANHLTIMDSLYCNIDTTFYVEALKLPEVHIDIKPDSVIYSTNPNITLSFNDSLKKIQNWTWYFGDSISAVDLNPVSHRYSEAFLDNRLSKQDSASGLPAGQIHIRLTYKDFNGCDTTITKNITLKKPELLVPNVFTPNGDSKNEQFGIVLVGEETKDFNIAYLANELWIYDRWGKKVFSQVNYKSNDWDGNHLADGTYYYILKLTEQYHETVLKGSVTILRGKD